MSARPISLSLVHRGKVRDSYQLPATVLESHLRLVYVSDRISIFDFVLGFEIPQKGEVLAVMSAFWRRHLLEAEVSETLPFDFESDVVDAGRSVDHYLPLALQGRKDLWRRATVVREVRMLPYEAIVRGYLTGSGFDAYRESGAVCGHVLPKGLADGARLAKPLFTPTTKAKEGHDEHLSYREVDAADSRVGACALAVYKAMEKHAESRGLIIADTKMEFGTRPYMHGRILVLADELGTPDSSRIWRKADYDASFPGALPPSFDKQFVREWGKKEGINDPKRFDPKNPEHRLQVRRVVPPRSVIDDTRDLYLSVPKMLTGMTLRQCQREFLNC